LLGADFVLLGRPFFYGIAALGEQGADHVVAILREELLHAMRQHGVVRPTRAQGAQVSPSQPSVRPVSAASSP
jgi:L-lactate dehydrogenase (cytochrome)